MLAAFILGFWCIWMGEREPATLLEAFAFTVLAIIIDGFMNWKVPTPDSVWMVSWGMVMALAAVSFILIDRFGSNLVVRLAVALIAGGTYFYLEQNGCTIAAEWMDASAGRCLNGEAGPAVENIYQHKTL